MNLKNTPAVVINTRDHGESDLIVTFYTPEIGKMSGIAPGAKRSKKRFMNKLEYFSYLDLSYQKNIRSSLVRIDQAELLQSFPRLRSDFQRYVAASYLCELLLHWTKENDSDSELFQLLLWALYNFELGQDISKTVIFFQIRLFTLLGFQPQLRGCVECGSLDHRMGPYKFSANRSGIVCSSCEKERTANHVPVSINTAKLLQKSLEMDIDKLERLHFTDASTHEAFQLLQRYCQHILQRDLNSCRLLNLHC